MKTIVEVGGHKGTDTVQEGRCEAAYNIALYKNTINDVESICTWLTTHNFEYTVVSDQWNKEADIHFKKIV